jgi:DNA mismatch repair ATPase MutS
MKAFLMYRDRDFDLQQRLPPNAEVLTQDLELDTLWRSMALDDSFLFDVSRVAVLSSLVEPEVITYRQDVLRDCLNNRQVVLDIYEIAIESIAGVRRIWRGSSPDSMLYSSVEALEVFVKSLKRLQEVAEAHAAKFHSEGFSSFFNMLAAELDDEYFLVVEDHLKTLRFRDGVLISARLGKGNKGASYVLRLPQAIKQSWFQRMSFKDRSAYSFQISERDEAGARALGELRGRGVTLVANAVSRSSEHILRFFGMLRTELAFYLGCLNLEARLTQRGEPTCFPVPTDANERTHSVQGLYDVCLSLIQHDKVTGNDVHGDGKTLVMITGANQGGKSTFLRSIGQAQLMMQCGMFVAANSFSSNICRGVFTHYKREEDSSMQSGKFDEELSRMSTVADTITPNCMMLFNESFAATNEREGAEIARQVIRALLDSKIKIFFVTHLYDLAQSLYAPKTETALFLRADRELDGRRTFRLVEAEPLPTSFGEDLYGEVFSNAPDRTPVDTREMSES